MGISPFVVCTSFHRIASWIVSLSVTYRAVIIYSHANAADCGTMLPRCTQISVQLDVDVIIYDYEGYGYSDGSPSEAAMIRDLEVVFKYALGTFSSKHIFLYGESSKFLSRIAP